ncbi:MAG: beta-ketoacyl-[acyl-carrier-protein] synthase family protein, partial [Gemmatimonadota bacterium]|nr:beta-ketoacyl-[acyl-carrier-protein] synthase family protein [Gemmatimonadota bacterium]
MTTEVHGVLPQVVVTGTGVVCSVGDGSTELAEAVVGGRSGIAPIQRFDTREFDVHLGAEVKGWKDPDATATATAEHRLCVGFAHRAALEALAQAAVHVSAAEPHRFGIVFGTNLGNGGRPVHELVVELGRRIGFEGPMLSVCTACSSSTSAIGLARDLLLSGFADVVLAGGSDVLTPEIFSGFHAMGVLSPAPCAPFSTPFGTTLGEGAGFLVLETEEGARARGVDVLATVSGWGISGDGYHETSPDPRGRGVERAIRSALDDAGLTPRDIGYVNAHGSGTQANDPSEWSGIQRGLDGSNGIWVSSSKGALGHAQGAAGALEAIITILMMRRGLVPPTLNFAGARNFAPADPVAGPAPREHAYDHAVSVNSAFGGANAAVVLSRSVPAATRSRGRRGVAILGVGAVTSHGLGVHSWEDSGFGQPRGAVPTFSFQEVDPMIDPRGLDPTSRFLTAAASLSLRDAGIRLSRADQDSAGLVLGSVRPSPAST